MSKSKQHYAPATQSLKELFTHIHQRKEEGYIDDMLERLKENAKRDGIRIGEVRLSDDYFGWVDRTKSKKAKQRFRVDPKKKMRISIPVDYDIGINDSKKLEVKFATLVHELGHLYCGHVGTKNEEWWPDRERALDSKEMEIEAECVAYLVCKKLNLYSDSLDYLSDYVGKRAKKWPPARDSEDCINWAADTIEDMCKKKMKPRDSKWLWIDAMLLDGMITFFVPEHEWMDDYEYYQSLYTGGELGMRGPIKGYRYVHAHNYAQWESIVEALRDSEKWSRGDRVVPTKDSWGNIDKVTQEYRLNKSLNYARKLTKTNIEKFEQHRMELIKVPSLRIHTCISGSTPGLIALEERQRAVERLQWVKREKSPMPWTKVGTSFFYKIAKTKDDAKEFLSKLEDDGWTFYSYWHEDEQDISDILRPFRMARSIPKKSSKR